MNYKLSKGIYGLKGCFYAWGGGWGGGGVRIRLIASDVVFTI